MAHDYLSNPDLRQKSRGMDTFHCNCDIPDHEHTVGLYYSPDLWGDEPRTMLNQQRAEQGKKWASYSNLLGGLTSGMNIKEEVYGREPIKRADKDT